MPEYHQIAVIIDVTATACAYDHFSERVNKLLASLNKPETMKANVYTVTDKLIDVIVPGQPVIWSNYTAKYDVPFDPQPAVKTIRQMYKHHSVIIMAPGVHADELTTSTDSPEVDSTETKLKSIKVSSLNPKGSKVSVPIPQSFSSAKPIVAVDPDLEKLLTEEEEEEEIEKMMQTAKTFATQDSPF